MSRATVFLSLAIAAAVAGCETPPASVPPGPPVPMAPKLVDRPRPARPPVPAEEVASAADPAAADESVAAGSEAGSESGSASGSGSELVRDGGACERAIQCASGICEGEGCSPDWRGVCVSRNRGCTRDLRAYCGCDGKTFRSSGSCPGRRFSARAACQ